MKCSNVKHFPADPVFCFLCGRHTCVSLKVLPDLDTHRFKFSADLLSLRDYLVLCTCFCQQLSLFPYKFSMVCSGYRKQLPMSDCGLSYSEYGTKSIKDLRKFDSLTICPHDYTQHIILFQTSFSLGAKEILLVALVQTAYIFLRFLFSYIIYIAAFLYDVFCVTQS